MAPRRSPTLFDAQARSDLHRQAPLAARLRPQTLDGYVGQHHLLAEGKLLRRAIQQDRLFSIILWGPPGSGKTTLAQIIAGRTQAHFEPLSAVSAGVADLRRVVQEAQDRLGMFAQRTVLFIDEIHRFNKSQQDAVLPYVEDGTLLLIGATTENPSFEVNPALLSRARVFTLEALSDEDIGRLIDRALTDRERGLGELNVVLAADARDLLLAMANGDARTALNALEAAAASKAPVLGATRLVTLEDIRDALQSRVVHYDKRGELHYDAISALHKCLRDSDPDAALYWLARMLDGGEDLLYIARRLVRVAIEDVGMADPQALPQLMAVQQAVHFLGRPEGDLALAQAVVYLAQAPKSNAVYRALAAARVDVEQTRNEPVPLHLRNAPTALMKGLGYGRGYEYAHDLPDGRSDQAHFPPNLAGRIYYEPTARGFETTVAERLAWRAERAAALPAAAALSPEPLESEGAAAALPEYAPGEEPQIAPDDSAAAATFTPQPPRPARKRRSSG
jgi:putative ATPase